MEQTFIFLNFFESQHKKNEIWEFLIGSTSTAMSIGPNAGKHAFFACNGLTFGIEPISLHLEL